MTYGGQVQLQAAASNPVASMTSNAISNSSWQVSQRTDVWIGTIEFQTQATYAKGQHLHSDLSPRIIPCEDHHG
ncbi:hypothetical protein [Erwinia tasmaniensis]|uniref:hypothetical protein n=1 Tax=Erwinia tasmaniensis TaxID=338565 RepID=UPI003A4E3258